MKTFQQYLENDVNTMPPRQNRDPEQLKQFIAE